MNEPSGQADEIRRYSFLRVFANDNTIDQGELAFLEKLALKDAVVDDEERSALEAIFSRVTQDNVPSDTWDEIQQFKARHNIP